MIAAYLALLDGIAETLAGDPSAAERAVRDAEAMVSGSGDRWYRGVHLRRPRPRDPRAGPRTTEAAEAVARIDTLPAPVRRASG